MISLMEVSIFFRSRARAAGRDPGPVYDAGDRRLWSEGDPASEVEPTPGIEKMKGDQSHPEAYYHQQALVAVEFCGPPEEVTGPFSALRGLHSHQVLFNLS